MGLDHMGHKELDQAGPGQGKNPVLYTRSGSEVAVFNFQENLKGRNTELN